VFARSVVICCSKFMFLAEMVGTFRMLYSSLLCFVLLVNK
jgi:hypothetical protein